MAKNFKGFKEGDVVDFHSIIGGPVTSENHTIKMLDKMCGADVAWITDHRGCVSIDALSK